MSKRRIQKPVRKPGRPMIVGPNLPGSPRTIGSLASLPPPSSDTTGVPPFQCVNPLCLMVFTEDMRKCSVCQTIQPPLKKPLWQLPPDSIVRVKALQIMALRVSGMSDANIAKELDLSEKSIAGYVYRAGKNGWLVFNSSAEHINNQLVPKALRNLDAMLDDTTDKPTQKDATFELLKGTAFKAFGEQQQAAPVQTVVAIRIETPAGPPQQIREGTIGGVPNFIEGELDTSKNPS